MTSRRWQVFLNSSLGRSPDDVQASVDQCLRAYVFCFAVWVPVLVLAMLVLEWLDWPSWPAVPFVVGFAHSTAEGHLRKRLSDSEPPD